MRNARSSNLYHQIFRGFLRAYAFPLGDFGESYERNFA